MKTTELDSSTIDTSISDFPSKPWKCFSLSKLQKGSKDLTWNEARNLIPREGGVYAFSFPCEKLKEEKYSITLDGPLKSKIKFEFSIDDLPPIHDDHFILYVGKTTNLFKRLQLHLRDTKTTTQVLHGMKKIFNEKFDAVKEMLLSSGKFYYFSLDGEENCANRDLIELGLCVKYRSPINIKSER